MVITLPFETHLYNKVARIIILIAILYIIIFKKIDAFIKLIILYKDIIILMAVLVVVMVISSIISPISTKTAFSTIQKIVPIYFCTLIAMLFFYQERFLSKNGKNIILVLLLIVLAIQLGTGIAQIFFQYSFKYGILGSFETGLTGITTNRNIFGFYMALGAVLTLMFFIKTQGGKRIKVFYLTLLALFFIGLLFSYSRTSWVFVFVFVTSYMVIFFNKLQKKDIILFVFILTLFILPILLFNSLGDRFATILDGDGSGRLEIWQNTIKMIADRLLLGYGVNTFYLEAWQVSFPHNFMLDILYSVGICGFIVSGCLLYLTFKEIINTNMFYLPLFLAFFVALQFDHDITSRRVLASLMLFAFFVFSNRLDKKYQKPNLP
jgi:O-antigen ligase